MNRMTHNLRKSIGFMALAAVFLLISAAGSNASIQGVTGPVFNFTAKADHIQTPDGNSILVWGYANAGGPAQYPGPTMIVTEGQVVTVNLTNQLSVPVSMVFPGHTVTASGGTPGLLTNEAPPDGVTTVTYSFTASRPGTYTYYSGTRQDLQVEMGLVGAIVVRPQTNYIMTGCNAANATKPMFTAYGDCTSAYEHEYLFLLSEMDHRIHELVEMGRTSEVDTTTFFPYYWFINGRNAPDTMAPPDAPWLPTQPYNCLPRMTPGERILLRFIGAGRDMHPFHTHANNFDTIARDGRLLESAPGSSKAGEVGALPDLAWSDFTLPVSPGATFDAIFTWTGAGMGWDIYGHTPADGIPCTDVAPADGFDDATYEYCADHNKPLPVILPDIKDLAFGAFYSGSPFLGAAEFLPPGEGGLNPNSGFFYMWHSHNEKEMLNNDIFPGGLMTMFVVEPPGTVIE